MEFLGVFYNGGIINDAAKPDKQGQGSFVACGTMAEPLAEYNEIGHITLAKTNGDKGTFKATSVFTTTVAGEINVVETCKWIFKRVDPTNPNVPLCP